MRQAPILKLALVALCAVASTPAFSAISDANLLDDVTKKFLDQASTWGGTITGYASWLFWALATISMVWTFGFMALRKADIGEFFAEFLRFTITTGFFWWLLSNGPAMGLAIVNGLRKIGAEAGGLPTLSASTPVDIAFNIVKKAMGGISWTNPIDNLGIVIISLVLVLCMAVVAANVLIALVTAWCLAYAGVFILGFGGARWTSDMAISYFKSMLAIGLELMTMALLIGVAVSVLDGFVAQLDASSVYELLVVLTVCAVLAMLISKIPGRIAGLAGTGGSGASVGVGGVMGAAALAGAAAATAGAALAGAAAQTAGAGSALMAAAQKASAAAESGGSSLASAFGGGESGGGGSSLAEAMGDGGSGGSSSSSMGGGGEGGSGGADSGGSEGSSGGEGGSGDKGGSGNDGGGKGGMAAKAAKIAAGTVSNLVQGGVDTLKAKSASMRTAAIDRIADTVGGKVASNIKASEGGNHLAPASDEVADFANRK
jgi:type IV secretion system protein VirB6/type IV secretion system protein TrbL